VISLFDRIDRAAGSIVESAVVRHHRRRLRRVGQLGRLEPPEDGSLWAAGNPPPRPGCDAEVLIDGEAALTRITDALAGARESVHVAGWHVTPGFELTRSSKARSLRELLGELAERLDVRVLLWAGAPLPVFSPRRSSVRRVRDELVRGTRVRCALDARERPMHCHHEKLVIVDGELAFVGGIDLTSLGGDRYDTTAHPVRGDVGWHDAATCVRGPAVADVAEHFAARWRQVEGERLKPSPQPAAAGDTVLQVVRTVPNRVYDFAPRGDFRILEAYIRALRSARSMVYLENQFLWSPEVVRILADKLRHPPSDRFRLVALLPARPNNGADDTRGQLAALVRADDGNGRFLAATIRSRSGARTAPLYVHAKVAVVDDAWLTLGSANLNEHSLFNDSEMNVVIRDRALARDTRLRLWSEHLEREIDDVSGDPTYVVDTLWKAIAAEQLERRRRGEPATHRLCELPGISRQSMALLGPLQGFVVDA
jgi:phosphatidylserine/phosphatidylglycerophosphate/cardiolipin synthase-like enzyme